MVLRTVLRTTLFWTLIAHMICCKDALDGEGLQINTKTLKRRTATRRPAGPVRVQAGQDKFGAPKGLQSKSPSYSTHSPTTGRPRLYKIVHPPHPLLPPHSSKTIRFSPHPLLPRRFSPLTPPRGLPPQPGWRRGGSRSLPAGILGTGQGGSKNPGGRF